MYCVLFVDLSTLLILVNYSRRPYYDVQYKYIVSMISTDK